MKFQKTAIAVTIAGFAAVPMMASADTVLSGVVQVKYLGEDKGLVDDPATPDVDEAESEEINMAAGDVRVGIVSEHELNSGLIGYGSMQLNLDDLTGQGGLNQSLQIPEVDTDGSLSDRSDVNLASAATVASDNVYVGIKGGFGDVRFGEIPVAAEYGQLANDIHDLTGDIIDGVSYTGTFGPVGVALNHSLAVDTDVIGAGVKFNFAGATIGLGFEDRDELTAFSAGASYAIAGFSLAAHVWSKGQLDLEVDTDGDDTTAALNESLDDVTAAAFKVGYGIAGVDLGLTFSVQTTQAGAGVDDGLGGVAGAVAGDGIIDRITTDEIQQTKIRFDASYALGGDTTVSTRIQNATDDVDGSEDELEYRVMLSKSF